MDAIRDAVQSRQWVAYTLKAAVVLIALFAVSRCAPALPVWGIALVWALFSIVPAIGAAYHVVIGKTYKQKQYQDGAITARFNSGRTISLIVAFVVSAACMASILVESPKWDAAMWVLVVLAVPGYLGISMLVSRFLRKEYAPLLQESRIAVWSAALLGVVMCIVFAIAMWLQPAASYSCAAEAFLAVPRPFDDSASMIMSEFGKATAVIDGLTAYALAKAAEGSFWGYVIWRIALSAGMFFGVAGLLSACAISFQELKRVFTPLENDENRSDERPLLKRYVVLSAALPIALAGGFVCADANATDIMSSREYTLAQEFARNSVSFAVYVYDGKYYDMQAVDDMLARAHEASEELSRDARERLVPLINASFDARVANVDAYLDWYYRLFGDWELLAQVVQGTAEDYAKEQFTAYIEEGIDDTELNAALGDYLKSTEALRTDTLEELSNYEITGDYPDWLLTEVTAEGVLDQKLAGTLEPTQKFLDAGKRLGISAATGIATGFIAKKLISRIVKKAVFKTLVERVTGLVTASSTAAAGGPPGVAVGVITAIAADIALQKADELMNRESYKQEIIETIEGQRKAMLAAVGAA